MERKTVTYYELSEHKPPRDLVVRIWLIFAPGTYYPGERFYTSFVGRIQDETILTRDQTVYIQRGERVFWCKRDELIPPPLADMQKELYMKRREP